MPSYRYYLPDWIKVGLELTFLPKRARNCEWRDLRKARVLADRFSMVLGARYGGLLAGRKDDNLLIKADPFRVNGNGAQTYDAYCIEVNGAFNLRQLSTRTSWYTDEKCIVEAVYSTADSLGLAPCIMRRGPKRGELVEFPTGGGHLMVGMDLWSGSNAWTLVKLLAFERGLCVDFANNPFIRWCFAQWLDDNNSESAFNRDALVSACQLMKQTKANRDTSATMAHNATLANLSIKQRFTYTGKAHYPTYEFRFFDMPRTPHQLFLQVRFLDAWLGYHREQASLMADETYPWNHRFSLTPSRFDRLFSDLPYARKQIERFWRKIGLDFADYTQLCWDEHYERRARFGRAL